MKIKPHSTPFIALLLLTIISVQAFAANEDAAVRSAMERAFTQLRAGDYGSLYEALPDASRQRISRDRFANGLQQARDSYGLELNRLDVGAVHVGRDVAVVDTVMYGRVARPIEGAGKVVARQYLVREGGQWRVAIGSNAAMRPFLAREPKFARQYPAREPRIYFERNGRWIDIGSLGAIKRRVNSR
jgi:hypothetical protein